MKYYLYKIVNNFDDKVYIGITKSPSRRWSSHVHKKSKCPKLRNAIQKYGKDNFEMVVLCIGEKDYILDLERKLISAYDSINNGYNVHEGGLVFSSEHFIKSSTKTDPVYVKGFWFPNRLQATESLNISDSTFIQWKRHNRLEQVGWLSEVNPKSKPVFVSGFWFKSVDQAASVLNISRTIAWRNSKLLDGGLVKIRDREGQRASASREVMVFGITYESIKSACELTGIPRRTLTRKLKSNHPDFKIIKQEEF